MHDAPDSDFFALQEALVGRYSLEREIGRGGMGIVYLAHEVALDRPVALKLLPPEFAGQPALRERFLREARTAAKLSHPHVVPIHSVDEVGDFVFFVMAYIDGGTLGERVRGLGPLPSKEAVRVLREVAWALAYAHAEGVVHRDVKPDNILLEKGSGRALVTDFGIAHVGLEPGRPGLPGMTGAREVLGTAEFMSPEQASGEEVDARSDMYSLGIVGFYALTGRFPFEGSTAMAVLTQHLTQPAPPVASVAPEVPAQVAQAIDRCLRKPPADRFADGAALAEAIGQGSSVERELPIPVRVYLKKIRELANDVPAIVILWLLVPFAAMAGVVVMAESVAEPAITLFWTVLMEAAYALLVLAATFAPFKALVAHTRRLLRAGFAVEDVRRALRQEVARRTEEIRFEYGKAVTWVDHAVRGITWGGFPLALGSMVWGILGGPGFLENLAIVSWNGATISVIVGMYRNKRRRDVIGEGWLSVIKGKVGKWLFRLGGWGLDRRALAGGAAHRPTEMAISLAADRLFESLPKPMKRELHGLPETIEKLESDAQQMRQQVEELSTLLAEIGDDPGRIGADERDALRTDLEGTRDEAQSRMTEAVTALERIRLGLLRMHAGDGNVESVTVDLGAARDVSEAIGRLVSGQTEVARLLEARRTTGRLGRVTG